MHLNTLLNIEKDFYSYLKKNYGLSRTDVFIIMTSERFENMTAYSLASKTGFDRSLIIKRLRLLEERGYISREEYLGKEVISVEEKSNVVARVFKNITRN